MNKESVRAAFKSSCRPIAAGYRRHLDEDGTSTSGILWALYDRGAAEEEVGWVADSGNTEFAERLTGMASSGPADVGCWFTNEPDIIVVGDRVLIKQFRGQNV